MLPPNKISLSPTSPLTPCIGIFDSGVGGLSVLKHIRNELPNEHLVYIADSGFAPYGEKAPEFICERSIKLAHYLAVRSAKAIVVACNTATAAAIDQLRKEFTSLPIVGMEPAIKPAVSISQARTVGVMATTETLKSEKFLRLSHQFGRDVEIVVQPCPGLVDLIEAGAMGSSETRDLLGQYVGSLLEKNVDVLVLGCTHYPFLLPIIHQLAPQLTVLDAGAPVARELKRRLQVDSDSHGVSDSTKHGSLEIMSTGDSQKVHELVVQLTGDWISEQHAVVRPLKF